jgi:hypothetical protein
MLKVTLMMMRLEKRLGLLVIVAKELLLADVEVWPLKVWVRRQASIE